MRRTALPAATVLLFGLAAPVYADTISLNDACAATLTALGSTGGTTQTAIFAGPRFSVGNRVIDAGAGTYGIINQELPPKERKAALRYLGASAAVDSWLNEGFYYGTQWNDSYSAALAQAAGLPADCASAAGPLQSASGTTYTYANVSVDVVEGRVKRWGENAFSFGPQQIDLPPGPTIPYSAWQKPSQAASLNSTLRGLTQTVARTADPTPTAIFGMLRDSIEPGRAVPIRLHKLRKGGLVSARNPYTKTYHAWRVYVKNSTPLARKVAP